ncbi:MAG: EAL domain-containing protein, partial [Planctomycetes bacterium]|nr:EAL domain-containing protein [Planctomycetota bacterium]
LDSQEAATIIHATIELGHRLGLKVVAEGVEDKLTAEWLAQLQCDVGQGHFFSAPLPSAEFLAWMDEWAGNHGPDSTHKRTSQPPGASRVNDSFVAGLRTSRRSRSATSVNMYGTPVASWPASSRCMRRWARDTISK